MSAELITLLTDDHTHTTLTTIGASTVILAWVGGDLVTRWTTYQRLCAMLESEGWAIREHGMSADGLLGVRAILFID